MWPTAKPATVATYAELALQDISWSQPQALPQLHALSALALAHPALVMEPAWPALCLILSSHLPRVKLASYVLILTATLAAIVLSEPALPAMPHTILLQETAQAAQLDVQTALQTEPAIIINVQISTSNCPIAAAPPAPISRPASPAATQQPAPPAILATSS